MLRALHAEPGLAALLGDWMHGDAVIGIRPARVLGADEDPFAALGSADDDAAGPFPRDGHRGIVGRMLRSASRA